MPICGTVSQISPPIRILVIAIVGLLGVWTLFLRPKEEVIPPVSAGNVATGQPAQSAPGKVAEAAKRAARPPTPRARRRARTGSPPPPARPSPA